MTTIFVLVSRGEFRPSDIYDHKKCTPIKNELD